ncbi:leucine-rich repeat and fibronectin type III domain-containing protein 1-like protein isoform X2 [Coccinella septempunctata]|uniref:leucine-rich repeat and fibronectin type III domain-containing protein 1-like protein isoform X2 n=1 Tax=Coccinella septempunctata TaxID=41139 RepID=UPI001D0795EA|nr:leucine-rich repeat and fibronectin type III domain-containing protein 1-like protein isoform X2 [Coccinella septempunctata]
MRSRIFILWLASAMLMVITAAQCPWQLEVPDLQSSCLCSYNLGHELSVQCDMVDWQKLLTSLHKYATDTPLDLLYVNNSTITSLKDNIFVNLKIQNIQLSGCKIKTIESDAFKGQERHLKNLNLQDNDIGEVPVESLRSLKTLTLLDFSHNRITRVPPYAFQNLTRLATLKLADNNVTLEENALSGLEGCLKNLNLKGTKQKEVPKAIQGMRTLAFLDLSQNSLIELGGQNNENAFEGLKSLTAINLERNLIQHMGENAFKGVRKTLSSLSLLNNLLPDFPTAALSSLNELRVLDIGFNLLTDLPHDAFKGNPSITLLALDGNPLVTIPYQSLSHLNKTLRGLSLGGRFLHCDCKLAWVIKWIREGDLQVTSRERNPQFCGSPPRFRDRGFYSIQPEELCTTTEDRKENMGVATVVSAELDDVNLSAPDPPPKVTTTSTTTTKKPPKIITSTTVTTTTQTTSKATSTASTSTTTTSTTSKITTPKHSTQKPKVKTTVTPWTQRPSLIKNYAQRNKADESKEVLVKTAFRQDNSVIIQWGSDTANILGFRVVYRLFGDKSFKQGPPLEASEREFKIKNVPSQECIIVCVVSLEDINVTPETVPYSQCREVRTVSSASSNMDKITIAASAAICGTIVVAIIIFVAASRRRSRKLHELHQHKMGLKNGLPMAGLPVNCCTGMGQGASPGGPLSSLAALNAYNNSKDWDQVSGYSTHSAHRPRMFSVDQTPSLIPDDMRSHFSNKDLRQSRQSLAMQSDRLSTRLGPAQSVASSTRRSRPRSRSRDHNRPSSRYSIAGSTHTLNNYCDNSDNWTDHDMEIYMARNPTTRNGLVPL